MTPAELRCHTDCDESYYIKVNSDHQPKVMRMTVSII